MHVRTNRRRNIIVTLVSLEVLLMMRTLTNTKTSVKTISVNQINVVFVLRNWDEWTLLNMVCHNSIQYPSTDTTQFHPIKPGILTLFKTWRVRLGWLKISKVSKMIFFCTDMWLIWYQMIPKKFAELYLLPFYQSWVCQSHQASIGGKLG